MNSRIKSNSPTCLLLLIGLLMALNTSAQASWTNRYNGPANGNDQARSVVMDGSGNVVVTGYSNNGGNDDYYTAKYASADGALIWENRYNGPANSSDVAQSVVVDGSGNVVVTGYSLNGGNYDYYTAKYASADGALIWEKRYNGPANSSDFAQSVVVDGSGNVVVTGYSNNGGNEDYYTAKYASADGALIWENRYNGPANSEDLAQSVVVDGSGNVVVTGYSFNGSNNDYYTAKYASADGALIWEKRYNGPANSSDFARSVVVDVSGSVVVAGYSDNGGNHDYYTAKYASADGALIWENRYNGPANGSDFAQSVVVDVSGSVVVTGYSSNGSNSDYYTAKYASADGALIWENRYNGPANSIDQARSVAVDGNGNVVVSGSAANGSNSDYYTAKYASADGALVWEKRYNGPANSSDGAQSVVVDGSGNVVVTGSSYNGSNYDYATIKYVINELPQSFMDFVPVGNAGNSNDVTTGYGAVAYPFAMGKYEVTLNQYAAFLSAVAAADTYALYNPAMATDLNIAGISRSGASGSYTYAVIGDGNRPVSYVSWFDAARFANWMHNGQPTGSQTAATTEDGAYTLNGATSGVGVSKNAGARYWIPSEDEWYKAAYHQPANQGGDSDDYWLYPTATNAVPNSRNGSSTDVNSANFYRDDGIANGFNGGYAVNNSTTFPTGNAVTGVGAFSLAESFYGTFDQGGNVYEWNDAVIGSAHGLRGGSWHFEFSLRAVDRGFSGPTSESSDAGFRLAATAAPLIAQQPQSQTVVFSSNATFSVSVGGISPFSYQWNFGGSPISGATNSSLTLSNVTFANQGNYSVVITNSFGSVTSSVAVLTIYVEPSGYAWTNWVGLAGALGGADGSGNAARFNYPEQACIDASGNIYVADRYSHTVRKISAAGLVTTLAGAAGVSGAADGIGSAARFNYPNAVAVDPLGTVYVADGDNSAIRKISPAGSVTTLAGLAGVSGATDATGSNARFRRPFGVAVDSFGNVFVADTENHTIRKITSGGVVTTFAGTAGMSGTNDGTGSAARFNLPKGVAVDSAGNILVADTDNGRIRRITPGGLVSTVVAPGFNFPFSLTSDSIGNIFVAGTLGHTIHRINSAGDVALIGGFPGVTGSVDGVGSGARFNLPGGIATDTAGNLYAVDSGNHRVSKGTPGYWPVILSQTTSATAPCSGGATNLSVQVNGAEPFHYRWYENVGPVGGPPPGGLGMLIVPNGTNNLTVTPSLGSTLYYTCVVSNSQGMATSATIPVTVSDTTPPVIVSAPTNQFLFVAAEVCSVPLPDYTTNILVTDCSGYSVVQTPAPGGWTFDYYAMTAGIPVQLVVTDGAGNSTNHQFTVFARRSTPYNLGLGVQGSGGPIFIPTLTTNSGVPVTLVAMVDNCFYSTWIEWYRNNVLISSNGTTMGPGGDATYAIPSLSPAETGNYHFVASDGISSHTATSAVVTVSIGVPPSANPPPAASLVFGADGFSLDANGTGDGPLTYQWRLNGTNIFGATGSTFTSGPGSPGNAGGYDVVICNPYGCVTSSVVAASFFGDLKFYAGTILAGGVGSQYRVDYADVIGGATNAWQTLTTVTLAYSPYLVIDPYSPTQAVRFYRAVPLP